MWHFQELSGDYEIHSYGKYYDRNKNPIIKVIRKIIWWILTLILIGTCPLIPIIPAIFAAIADSNPEKAAYYILYMFGSWIIQTIIFFYIRDKLLDRFDDF